MSKHSNRFFLISFLPALAYWYLEANYDLKTALVGGGILASVEIVLERWLTGHIHALSKLNFFLIVGLGGLSYLASEGIWFKLQPFFTGVILFVAIQWKLRSGLGFLGEMWQTMGRQGLPMQLLSSMERQLSFFVLAYGVWMAYVALKLSTDQWVFFKTAGFYACFFFFSLLQLLWMRKKLRSFSQK